VLANIPPEAVESQRRLGLIEYMPFSAPYEDLRLKGR
jgi:hypothetical protein